MRTVIHFVCEIKCHCHEHVLHEVVWCISDVYGLMPANIGIASYHWFTIRRTELKHSSRSECSHTTSFCQINQSINQSKGIRLTTKSPVININDRRKSLISNRGRWSPLSLYRQVHLGVGKSEYNSPFSGLRAASTWEAVGFCGSHRQTDVLAKLSSWLGG